MYVFLCIYMNTYVFDIVLWSVDEFESSNIATLLIIPKIRQNSSLILPPHPHQLPRNLHNPLPRTPPHPQHLTRQKNSRLSNISILIFLPLPQQTDLQQKQA